MTGSVERWQALGVHPPLDVLRARKREATQSLLGDTITYSDDDWHQPSRLPGWTRAHVAAHVSRNADALRRVVHGLFTAQPTRLYPNDLARVEDIERGARRIGMDLQIDLDTSAGRLSDAFDQVEDSGAQDPVDLGPRLTVPVPIVALARVSEVVLHHCDMGVDGILEQLDPVTAQWLAAWELHRSAGDARLPAMVVRSDSGLVAAVGPDGPPSLTLEGSDADLVRWLSGRGDSAGLRADADVPVLLPPR